MFNVAVIGAGFSGLAVAWHLLNDSPELSIRLTLFDAKGVGGGTSGIATGLLHPFSGAHAKLNRMGLEGLKETHQLLEVSKRFLNKPVAEKKGILRLALTKEQRLDFTVCAAKYPLQIEWLLEEQCQQLYPYLAKAPGIWINEGHLVHSQNYLMGLWMACKAKGAILEKRTISSLKELAAFDAVAVAAGANCLLYPELSSLGLTVVKGQLLELEWPSALPPLSFALNSQTYLIMEKNRCLVGSTYEKDFFR